MVGDNFHCGRGGEGDVDFPTRPGRTLGFEVSGVDLVHVLAPDASYAPDAVGGGRLTTCLSASEDADGG